VTLPIFVVDAFTAEPFGGNPAAVVPLDADVDVTHVDDAWMQRVAAEMKHSETAFVRPTGDGRFDLRWFTPEVEVDLCGHATLATAHVLWETQRLDPNSSVRFSTRSGELGATRDEGRIRLDFPLTDVQPAPPVAALFDALGLPPGDMFRAGDFFALVAVDDPGTVRALTPDFGALRGVDSVRAVIVTARGDGAYDCVSRVFAPRMGIDEDPVTGSAHCALAAYWCPRLGHDELRASQASARGGEMLVRRVGDRAHLLGTAVTVLEGFLRT
jgi:PhzF family phenazine biosynthesis protein